VDSSNSQDVYAAIDNDDTSNNSDVDSSNDDEDESSNASTSQDVEANDDADDNADNHYYRFADNIEADNNDDDFKSFRDENDDITDEDIERMMMTVRSDNGFQGNCGVNYKFAVGDTYKCYDKKLRFTTTCVIESANLHLCCVEGDDCDDLDDMKAWRF
jgi:hypothetical protein